MRTKVLLCAAALAVSLASSMAQVYSLNVVGYYNVTIPQGQLAIIANQLNTTNNQIQYVIPTVNDDTLLYKYNGGFSATTYEDFLGGWDQPTWTLNPGEAAFIKDPGEISGGQTITFVGTVLQGSLTNNLTVGGICFRSALVPVAGTPQSFGVPAQDDDIIYTYSNGYNADTYEDFLGGWGDNAGAGPNIAVGQGFGYIKPLYNTQGAWIASFTVQ